MAAYNTPLPPGDDGLLDRPQPAFHGISETSGTPRSSVLADSLNTSGPLIPPAAKQEAGAEYASGQTRDAPTGQKRRGLLFWAIIGLAALIVLVLAIILPVYFKVIKPNQNNASSNDPTSSDGTPGQTGVPGKTPVGALSGGDGSEVTMEDGSKFTYNNKFGGFWVSDPKDPFSNNARPNSWTPPLNTSWNYAQDKIYGVNLGGLFVLEPFISPALFQKYPGTIDEWTLSEAMAADTASGGLNQLEEHYKTFITEKDIADIASAGLNWVRLPVPYWAIETWEGEPFLAKTSWKYIVRVFDWCRKYGIRVNVDLHTIPGSQNAFNHSGKKGQINFLNGVMGLANAQRALNYIRIFTEFFSQPEYRDVVPMFSIMNEAVMIVIGRDQLTSFYLEAHRIIREITGFGEGNGPHIVIHDAFYRTEWNNFLPGADRIGIDTHPYFAFSPTPDRSPIDTGTGEGAGGKWPAQACTAWGKPVRDFHTNVGVAIAGEFSNGINDCGLFLRGPDRAAEYGDCAAFDDYQSYTPGMKAGLRAFTEASMDTFGHWFFWTWKIGNSLTSGRVESPLWSYQLGMQEGWIPEDPREAEGKCSRLGVNLQPLPSTYQPYMTGGAGAGTVDPAVTAQFPWPPAVISSAPAAVADLPTYTATGTVATLTPLTYPSATHTIDGWFNDQDIAGAPTPIAGCTYPDPWMAEGAALPPPCSADVTTAVDPAITAPPTRRGLRFPL